MKGALAYLAVCNLAGIAGCVYLVTHDSPWWAALVLLVGCGQRTRPATDRGPHSTGA